MSIDFSEDGNDNIFCYLTDWMTATSTARRNKGDVYKHRFAIAANKFCWGIVELRDSGATVYHVYVTSFEDMCPYFKSVCNINMSTGLRIVVETLRKFSSAANVEIQIPENDIRTILASAKQIDVAYKTDYAIYNDVREHIFKNDNTESVMS